MRAFKTSLSFGIEAIASLIPIHLHLQKLRGRLQLRAHSLPTNHILCSLMESNSDTSLHLYPLSLSSLTRCQCGLIKDHLVNMNNHFNEVFPSFDPLNPEFSPGDRIIDCFPNCFSFHLFNKSKDQHFKSYIQQLDNLAIESSNTLSNALVVTNASVKNNVASSIAHVHVHNKPIIKMLHHTSNIMSIEAEFFAIRCGINQATHLHGILKIIVVIDSIYTAKKIFDPLSHPFLKHAAFILKDLREFFFCHQENIIKFWECLSQSKWYLHRSINAETKSFNLTLLLPNKNSWDFSKKSKCDNIINKWKMTFQASDLKSRHFLELVDSDNNILEPSYSKGSTWLKYFGYSNTLYARASRVTTNHAPIGEY